MIRLESCSGVGLAGTGALSGRKNFRSAVSGNSWNKFRMTLKALKQGIMKQHKKSSLRIYKFLIMNCNSRNISPWHHSNFFPTHSVFKHAKWEAIQLLLPSLLRGFTGAREHLCKFHTSILLELWWFAGIWLFSF